MGDRALGQYQGIRREVADSLLGLRRAIAKISQGSHRAIAEMWWEACMAISDKSRRKSAGRLRTYNRNSVGG
eukprot:773174-Rhodomonas_salina.3